MILSLLFHHCSITVLFYISSETYHPIHTFSSIIASLFVIISLRLFLGIFCTSRISLSLLQITTFSRDLASRFHLLVVGRGCGGIQQQWTG